jgi:hypothetical protein
MEEYGDPRFGEFFVARSPGNPPRSQPSVIVEISGGVLQEAYSSDPAVQLVLVDWDTESCTPGDDNGMFHAGGKTVYVTEMPVTPIDEIVETVTEKALEAAGINVLDDDGLQEQRRWVLYDFDGDVLVGTRVYTDHDEAVENAAQANDILVLPLVIQGIAK